MLTLRFVCGKSYYVPPNDRVDMKTAQAWKVATLLLFCLKILQQDGYWMKQWGQRSTTAAVVNQGHSRYHLQRVTERVLSNWLEGSTKGMNTVHCSGHVHITVIWDKELSRYYHFNKIWLGGGGGGLDWSGSGSGDCSCEHDNEPSSSTRYGEFLD